MESINRKEPVAFGKVTDLMLEDHLAASLSRTAGEPKSDSSTARIFLNRLVDKAMGSNANEIKAAYELELERIVGAPVVYNRDFTSVLDISRFGKLQCYSGSILHELVIREKFLAGHFRDSNFVVIFESGHVLPGFMIQEGASFRLFGVETTASGRARIDYGLASSLDSSVRVVDAELFALVELFKFELKDGAILANEVLKRTADRYQIARPFLIETSNYAQQSYAADRLNWSPFGFGSPSTPSGDRTRSQMDDVTRSALRGEITGASVGGVPTTLTPPFETPAAWEKYLAPRNPLFPDYVDETTYRIYSLTIRGEELWFESSTYPPISPFYIDKNGVTHYPYSS